MATLRRFSVRHIVLCRYSRSCDRLSHLSLLKMSISIFFEEPQQWPLFKWLVQPLDQSRIMLRASRRKSSYAKCMRLMAYVYMSVHLCYQKYHRHSHGKCYECTRLSSNGRRASQAIESVQMHNRLTPSVCMWLYFTKMSVRVREINFFDGVHGLMHIADVRVAQTWHLRSADGKLRKTWHSPFESAVRRTVYHFKGKLAPVLDQIENAILEGWL